jgi:hypothetical protein
MLLAIALAALLLIAAAPQALSQTPYPLLLPVASIFVDGNQNNCSDYNYLKNVNDAFFADPPADFWAPGTGLVDLPLNSVNPSENMILTSAPFGGQAVPGGGAYVIDGNVLYLGICCYWNNGFYSYPCAFLEAFPYIHFQARVEAAQPLPAGGFADNEITGTWDLVTNVGLDVLCLDADINDVYPQYAASDTIISQPNVSDPWTTIQTGPGLPDPVVETWAPDAFASAQSEQSAACLWVIRIVLPQALTRLRVGLQAQNFATPLVAEPNSGDTYVNNYQGVFYPSPGGLPGMPTAPTKDQQGIGTILIEQPPAGGFTYPDSGTWDFSPPFSVCWIPSSVFPLNCMPCGIIYNLPGNQSSLTFTSQNNYSVTMSFGNSMLSSVADVQGYNFDFNPIPATLFGVKLPSVGLLEGGTSTQTMSDTTANTTSFMLSGTLAISRSVGAKYPTYYTVPAGDNLASFWQEPFWYDQISVLPYPLLATWSAPAVGSGSPFSATQLLGFLGANAPSPIYFELWQLYCAWRNNSPLTDVSGILTISPQECLELLNLDPFFAGGMWQGVDPTSVDQGRFVRLTAISDIFGGPPVSFNMTETSSWTFQNGPNTVVQSDMYGAMSGLAYNGFGGQTTANTTQMQTTTTTLNYQNQQMATSGQMLTTMAMIQDMETSPATIVVYYDLLFNSVCFQDTHEPPQSGSIFIKDFPPFCKVPGPFTFPVFVDRPSTSPSPPSYPIKLMLPTWPIPPFPPIMPLFSITPPPQAPPPVIRPFPPPPVAVVLPQPPIPPHPPIFPPPIASAPPIIPPPIQP